MKMNLGNVPWRRRFGEGVNRETNFGMEVRRNVIVEQMLIVFGNDEGWRKYGHLCSVWSRHRSVWRMVVQGKNVVSERRERQSVALQLREENSQKVCVSCPMKKKKERESV